MRVTALFFFLIIVENYVTPSYLKLWVLHIFRVIFTAGNNFWVFLYVSSKMEALPEGIQTYRKAFAKAIILLPEEQTLSWKCSHATEIYVIWNCYWNFIFVICVTVFQRTCLSWSLGLLWWVQQNWSGSLVCHCSTGKHIYPFMPSGLFWHYEIHESIYQ